MGGERCGVAARRSLRSRGTPLESSGRVYEYACMLVVPSVMSVVGRTTNTKGPGLENSPFSRTLSPWTHRKRVASVFIAGWTSRYFCKTFYSSVLALPVFILVPGMANLASARYTYSYYYLSIFLYYDPIASASVPTLPIPMHPPSIPSSLVAARTGSSE